METLGGAKWTYRILADSFSESLLERLIGRGARARYGERFEWRMQSEVEEQDKDWDACVTPPILFPSFPSAHSDLVHRNVAGRCG